METLDNILGALAYFLVAIGAISLLVGGIGIMNIMLVAVNRRIKEIGLRKAIGAKHIDILIQFLIEAVIVTFIGAIIGIILGAVISTGVAFVARSLGYKWSLIIPITSVLIASFASIMIGLVFGLFPAQKAAKLHPIEALRYE